MSDDDDYIDLYDDSPDDFEGDHYLGSDHGGEFNAPSFDANTLPTKKQKDELIEGLKQPHAAKKDLLRDFADGDDTDVGGTALDIANNEFITLNSGGRMSDAVYFPIRAADLDVVGDCMWLQKETDRYYQRCDYHADRSWNQIKSRIKYRNRDAKKKRRDRFNAKQRSLEKMGYHTTVAYDMADEHLLEVDEKKFIQLCLDCFAEYLTMQKSTLRMRKDAIPNSQAFFVETMQETREEVRDDDLDRAMDICHTRYDAFVANGYEHPRGELWLALEFLDEPRAPVESETEPETV